MTVFRRYQMTRIAAGDYLLPSNDKKKLWRISKYTEGPSSGLDWPSDKEVWGIWEWTGPLDGKRAIDPDDWSPWSFHEGLHDTRSAAIDSALKPPSDPRKKPEGAKTLQQAIQGMIASD